MTKYRMYVDEVGNPDLESSDNPNHRFLSLTGVITDLLHSAEVVHPEMEQLKENFFRSHPDEPLILHRKELVNAKPPFQALRDPAIRSQFDEKLLELLSKWEYTVITVCIDKKRHKETYTTWRYDPYHYCLEVLLERYVFFLQQHYCQGDVMAESRGGREDRRLKASFERLSSNGTHFVTAETIQNSLTSRQLKVKPKANNIAGLQLADLIAHPSRAEILYEQELLGKSLATFAEKVIHILQSKYYARADQVYGKKFL